MPFTLAPNCWQESKLPGLWYRRVNLSVKKHGLTKASKTVPNYIYRSSCRNINLAGMCSFIFTIFFNYFLCSTILVAGSTHST